MSGYGDGPLFLIDAYIRLGNATQAAKEAGYKQKYIGPNATKILNSTNVFAEYRRRLEEMEKSQIASEEEILRFHTGVMRGEVKEEVKLDTPLHGLGQCTRAAEVLTYADVWAMDGDGRSGRGSRTARQESRPDEDGRQGQQAARLPSFLCTNTFVAAFELVPIMYRYRNKDELGNSCALLPTTQ